MRILSEVSFAQVVSFTTLLRTPKIVRKSVRSAKSTNKRAIVLSREVLEIKGSRQNADRSKKRKTVKKAAETDAHMTVQGRSNSKIRRQKKKTVPRKMKSRRQKVTIVRSCAILVAEFMTIQSLIPFRGVNACNARCGITTFVMKRAMLLVFASSATILVCLSELNECMPSYCTEVI
jgi:hypothetical protein